VGLNHIERLAIEPCRKHFAESRGLLVGHERRVAFHLFDGLGRRLSASLAAREGVPDLMAIVALSHERRSLLGVFPGEGGQMRRCREGIGPVDVGLECGDGQVDGLRLCVPDGHLLRLVGER